jgi:signal transduction histidine kinase
MIPILLFISLCSIVGLAGVDNADVNLLFVDLNKNDYFYDAYVLNAESWAHSMFWLQSEEHIRNMGCLEWQLGEYSSDKYGEQTIAKTYELVSTYGADISFTMGSIPANDINTLQAEKMVEDAIFQQLRVFSDLKNKLEETPGLSYYITDGTRRIGNVSPDAVAKFFRWQPVYRIVVPGKAYEQSRTSNNQYAQIDYVSGVYSGDKLSSYIAFSEEAVSRQNDIWKITQRQLGIQLINSIAMVIIALALVVILLVGAGRKYGDETREIAFMAIDKPWLDLSLCVLAGYEVLTCGAIYVAMSTAWRYGNIRWIYTLCAVLSVFFTLPLLWWLLSFTKYCKAGKWWRHTLIHTLITGICQRLKLFAKSLWSGFPLTMRAVLLGCVLFVVNLICALTYPAGLGLVIALIITAIAVFGLLRYTRKLYLVEQGAKAACGGWYDHAIDVTGGELGSIAASINSISDGINTAVSERMKSERLKTELITNISHDIRTPLTSLITYTDLLKSEGFNSERAPEYLEILIQKSARLKTLTEDLFEASNAASGNIEVHKENLDFADLVRQVLGELDERVRASGLDFRLNLPEHAMIHADGKLLWRVMENLLSNVFKYALKGSRVYIDIVPEQEKNWYKLDIKNISERPLNVDPSELTERFKRGDDARGGDGSGLGLSIAQSFVQSQGGRFELSIDGDLFKATVYLPSASFSS